VPANLGKGDACLRRAPLKTALSRGWWGPSHPANRNKWMNPFGQVSGNAAAASVLAVTPVNAERAREKGDTEA
jgi:hypothetical protein